ncbi:MAG: hypothetical protein ACLFPB_05720 [Desulfovermiculus sp.]
MPASIFQEFPNLISADVLSKDKEEKIRGTVVLLDDTGEKIYGPHLVLPLSNEYIGWGRGSSEN